MIGKQKYDKTSGNFLIEWIINLKKTGKSRLSSRPFPDQYLTDFTQISSGEYSTA